MLIIDVKSDRRGRREFARLERVEQITRRAIRQAWFQLGDSLKATANREILKPKSGRVYIVRGPRGGRRRHRASRPGETHANRSGRLRRAISWRVRGWDRLEFGYGVSSTARNATPRYDEYVEFGTVRMDERPSLDNAIKLTQNQAAPDFEAAMTRAFRGFS